LYDDVTGVILAGGRSSRMGRDKATLEFSGTSLFENIAGVFGELFVNTLIAGDRPDLARPGLRAFADEFPGSALGGLYTGLKHADTPYVFVSACDMPFVDAPLIRSLADRRHDYDVVLPRTRSGLEPLFACYGKRCLEIMRRQLESGNFRILDIYPQLEVRIVTEDELPANWQRALTNINTPQDFSNLQKERS
jgi:molybdopterin-guanine dinucleotide biosynthesis protein A